MNAHSKIAYMLLAAAMFCACQRDQVEYTSFDKFQVLSQGELQLDKQYDTWAGQIGSEPVMTDPSDEDQANQVEGKSTFMQMFSPLLNMLTCNSVHQIAGTYESEFQGQPITLSGKIYLPKRGEIKGIILACHYTVAALSESPSQCCTLSALLATTGYAVVDADYVGFGVTYQMVHPYLDVESTSRSVADFGLVAQEYLAHIGRKPITDDVFIFGYSQGAHSATAAQALIENDPRYEALHLKKVFCGGGPYDPEVTYKLAVESDEIGFPAVAPMFVQGTVYAQKLDERFGFNEEAFLSDTLCQFYKSWLNSKAFTMDQVNTLMKGIGCGAFSGILRPEALDPDYAANLVLFEALRQNQTIHYTPKTPMYIFHSSQDDVVKLENALSLQASFRERGLDPEWEAENITYDFGDYGVHRSGLLKFHFNVLKMFKDMK